VERAERAARIACRLWQAAREESVQRSKSGLPAPGGVEQDSLMREMADVVIAYLQGPIQGSTTTGPHEEFAADDITDPDTLCTQPDLDPDSMVICSDDGILA
jgi:hypothetical protein